MTAPDDLESRYLRALAKLNSSLGHDARGQLGHLTIQIDLMREILKRADPGDPDAQARLEHAAEKARGAARDVERSIERILTATRTSTGDLGQTLRIVAELLSPLLHDRG